MTLSCRITCWLLRHFARTITLAKLYGEIHAEMKRRAESATRANAAAPGQLTW